MTKVSYTKLFLSLINEHDTYENLNQKLFAWWMNPRNKNDSGLRLTDEGHRVLSKDLNLACYEIWFPVTLELKPSVYLNLDKFISCPYHLTQQVITVYSEQTAVEILIFSGDVKDYGISVALSRKFTPTVL